MASIDNLGRTSGITSTFGTGGTDQTSRGPGVGGGVSNQSGAIPPGDSGGTQNFSALANLFTASGSTGGGIARLDRTDPQQTLTLKEYEAALKTVLDAVRDPDVLAALLIEMTSMSRQNALDSRLQARSQARSELEGQAAETREAATKMLASAIVGMVISVVSAAIAIGGAAKSGGSIKESASHTKDAHQANKIMDSAEGGLSDAGKLKLTHQADNAGALARNAQLKGDLTTQLTGALTGLANAVKSLTEGSLGAASKMDDAQGQELAAAAQDTQANADVAKKIMDELEEMIKAAIQFLKEMAQAETDMMATASRL